MFFGTNLGVLSSTLQYENGMEFSGSELLLNLVCILAIALAIIILARFKAARKLIPRVLVIAAVAVVGMGAFNVVQINAQTYELAQKADEIANSNPHFSLSKNGKNVVVIMLDRAMGQYVPYLINEKPELKEIYSGFTYYPNVISFGRATNFGSPALFGGYEYTPEEINKRSNELLKDKHNEALKVMPVIFDESNYDVSVINAPYANYKWYSDTSIYKDYPDINAYVDGSVFDKESKLEISGLELNKRNMFCFGITKSMPLVVQKVFYSNGTYNNSGSTVGVTNNQVVSENGRKATGHNYEFDQPYEALCNLKNITSISDELTNTFMMMSNDTTHFPMLLQEPDYIPSDNIDNTEYEDTHPDKYKSAGEELKVGNDPHYHTNMAALLRLGDWLNYLKGNDVYDNTRIIITSDHGRELGQLESLIGQTADGNYIDYEGFYPLLMVKDFNSSGFNVDETFMTNGDVPTLALENLIRNPINPFTGKQINNQEKTAHKQHVYYSNSYSVTENNGTTFIPDGRWFSVSEDMRDKNNWQEIDPPQS